MAKYVARAVVSVVISFSKYAKLFSLIEYSDLLSQTSYTRLIYRIIHARVADASFAVAFKAITEI